MPLYERPTFERERPSKTSEAASLEGRQGWRWWSHLRSVIGFGRWPVGLDVWCGNLATVPRSIHAHARPVSCPRSRDLAVHGVAMSSGYEPEPTRATWRVPSKGPRKPSQVPPVKTLHHLITLHSQDNLHPSMNKEQISIKALQRHPYGHMGPGVIVINFNKEIPTQKC